MTFLTLNLSEWASLATIIGATAIGAFVMQALIMRKQLKADHERGRREKTVELLTEWFARQKKEGPIARKITENLNETQCRDILAQRSITVPIKLGSQLVQLFGTDFKYDESGKEITLTESQSAELRWQVVCYLNSLEMILIAWQYSIVDRQIVETQFAYLFKPAEGHEILKEFRTAAGSEEAYPAIEIFVTHLKNLRRNKLIEKANVA
jgi:hypothetical protein